MSILYKMDIPLKVELPRLSHADVLKVLLPIVPGGVLMADAMLAGFRPIPLGYALGLGYKTTVVIAVICSYLAGVSLTITIDTIFQWAAQKIWPMKGYSLSADPYWRLLATKLVGQALTPDAMKLDEGTAKDQLKRVLVRNEEAMQSQEKMEKKAKEVKELLATRRAEANALNDGEAKTKALGYLTELDQTREELDKTIAESTIKQAKEYAWIQLSFSLTLCDPIVSPYEGYDAVLLAILSSALTQLVFAASTRGNRCAPYIVVSIILLAIAGYGRAKVFRLSKTYQETNMLAITSLLKRLTLEKAPPPDRRPER